METKHKVRGGKGQEKAYLAFKAMPESLDECTVLGLLRFGGQTLLKSAIAAEITEHLHRGYYEHGTENRFVVRGTGIERRCSTLRLDK